MNRNILIRLWSNLYGYRVFRWLLYAIIGIVVAGPLIEYLADFELEAPSQLADDMFPYPDVPASQLAVLEDLLYASKTLFEDLHPILEPENTTPEQLQHYSTLLRYIETATNVSWLVLHEADVRGTLRVISELPEERSKPFRDSFAEIHPAAGTPLTTAELQLSDKHDFYSRAAKASAFASDLYYKTKQWPDSWHPAYVSTYAPPAVTVDNPPDRLTLTAEQRAQAHHRLEELMTRRDTTIRILKKYPPKPMGFSPTNPEAMTRTSKADIAAGNLLGNADWKPMWGGWRNAQVWKHIEEDENEQVALGKAKPTTQEDIDRTVREGERSEARRKRRAAFAAEERAKAGVTDKATEQ